VVLEVFVALATSIPLARVIGPERLGYYGLMVWVANMSSLLGSMGAPAATRKYMAERLGKGRPGEARAVFQYTFRAQVISALGFTVAAMLAAWKFSDRGYETIGLLVAASLLPSMVLMIPAQANQAAENMRANVPATLISQTLYTIAVWVSLWRGWDLLGVSAGVLIYKWVELFMRLIPARRWLAAFPQEPLPAELRERLHSFSIRSLAIMLLNVLVWSRSDLLLLRALSPDMRQLTFFSLAQNLSEKAILVPRIFSVAAGASLMAQFGRDPEKLSGLLRLALRYLLLAGMPLLWGMSAVSVALVPALYGSRYMEAIPVLALATMAAVPASIFMLAQNYLEAREQQRSIITWTCAAGVVKLAMDWLLIPHWGALGAAVGNSSGQLAAALGIWGFILSQGRLRLDWPYMARIAVATAMLYVAAHTVAQSFAPWPGLLLGVAAGTVTFLVALRLLKVLDAEDGRRLLTALEKAPAALRPQIRRVVGWLAPAAA
jgi:O-antigen/teichoic acid export membrane protein